MQERISSQSASVSRAPVRVGVGQRELADVVRRSARRCARAPGRARAGRPPSRWRARAARPRRNAARCSDRACPSTRPAPGSRPRAGRGTSRPGPGSRRARAPAARRTRRTSRRHHTAAVSEIIAPDPVPLVGEDGGAGEQAGHELRRQQAEEHRVGRDAHARARPERPRHQREARRAAGEVHDAHGDLRPSATPAGRRRAPRTPAPRPGSRWCARRARRASAATELAPGATRPARPRRRWRAAGAGPRAAPIPSVVALTDGPTRPLPGCRAPSARPRPPARPGSRRGRCRAPRRPRRTRRPPRRTRRSAGRPARQPTLRSAFNSTSIDRPGSRSPAGAGFVLPHAGSAELTGANLERVRAAGPSADHRHGGSGRVAGAGRSESSTVGGVLRAAGGVRRTVRCSTRSRARSG